MKYLIRLFPAGYLGRMATHIAPDGVTKCRITPLAEGINPPSSAGEVAESIDGYTPIDPMPRTPTLLETMDAAFESQVPPEIKPQLAGVYAQVRVLIQAQKPALAIALIAATEVPEELESVKVSILALIPNS